MGRNREATAKNTTTRNAPARNATPKNVTPRNATPATKVCERCGRTIEWRKKWERDWDSVRFCSQACRSTKLTDTDRRLEATILELLGQRRRGATICPSDAARRLEEDEDAWRALLEPTRRAARRLVAQGTVEITQKGLVVDPSTAKGPIRIRLTESG